MYIRFKATLYMSYEFNKFLTTHLSTIKWLIWLTKKKNDHSDDNKMNFIAIPVKSYGVF